MSIKSLRLELGEAAVVSIHRVAENSKKRQLSFREALSIGESVHNAELAYHGQRVFHKNAFRSITYLRLLDRLDQKVQPLHTVKPWIGILLEGLLWIYA